MARLDVFRLSTGDIAIDCQSDLLSHLATRFTVPLIPPDRVAVAIAGLHPSFDVAGEQLVMATHLAGAIPAREMKTRITSLIGQDHIVQRALDMLAGTY